ncbi:threonyl-tRNA synthetase [Tulasnella sp. 425]|nr:threonyl-tRNA synthetase [Tulasnella sp. 425]
MALPLDIAKEISKGLADRLVIAKVDGELWDLERPLKGSCKLELQDFERPEGKKVFWHSSAHVLGEAAEKHYGCQLCLGPPTDEGFFCEKAIQDRSVVPADYPNLETLSNPATKEKQKFERLVMKKEDLLEMFAHKKHFIETKVPDGTSTAVYRCGPMTDLCIGPHIPHTGRIKAFMVTKSSASYWLNDANNNSLQHIYGISFPDTKQLKEYKNSLAEAAKRDHRNIGKVREKQEQELFFWHDLSPGSTFALPHGARIYKLVELMKQHYKDDMFVLDVDKDKFALKPMNCPVHCLIFDARDRSYKELPIRMAEFGDDTHIFCMPSQIESEMDFQLPEWFKLKYRGPDVHEDPERVTRPVMIYCAILGSLERFIGILTEHTAGKWPFWVSPRQALVVPVAAPFKDYASEVAQRLQDSGLFVDMDNGENTLPKKIRNSETAQYNFIPVVGEEEMKSQSVNVGNREDRD